MKMFKSAFTLIELLVVIGIIVVLTAASVAGISASRNRKQVKSTAEKLKSFLTEARSLAVNPQDTSFGVQKILVAIDNPTGGTNTIKMYKYNGSTYTEIDTPKFKIPNGITVKAATSTTHYMTPGSAAVSVCPTNACNYISFSMLPTDGIGKIIDTTPDTASDINIDITDSSQTYKLKMNVLTGMITITE